jgi:5-methyltetrahydropteroyltriglutamate--homocysteine methyltransferase
VPLVRAFVPGLYPRSESLVQATRDLDRGRTMPDAVAEQVARDLREFVRVQEDAGLDLLADGLLTWQDLFRPLVESSAGLSARPLVRFLDTNTFYRAVLVDAEPRLQRPLPAPELPSGRWLATLPSPFAFSRAADREVSAEALAANVLAPQVDAYAEAGCALVVLAEPFLPREPSGLPALVAALAELPRPVPLMLQLPFGDAAPLLPELAEAGLDGIGVDFYATRADAVPEQLEATLLAGVVDARNSVLEDASELATFAEELRDRVAGEVVLVPNGDLQFVPEPIAREKVLTLGRARTARPQEAVA